MTSIHAGNVPHTNHASTSYDHDIATQAVVRDRVRWGPVIAGLFASLSTLAVLAVLGIAIGFSSIDANDSARAFGIGAGIWTIISVLIAFFVGGAVAAYTAATPATDVSNDGHLRKHNGLLQGAMVWMVTIPLSIYFLAGGVGSALGVAGRAAATGAEAASNVAGAAAQNPDAQNAAQQAAGSVDVQGTLQSAQQQVQQAVTPDRIERAGDYAGGAAWGTLASMLVGLGAASAGGFVGGRARTPTV